MKLLWEVEFHVILKDLIRIFAGSDDMHGTSTFSNNDHGLDIANGTIGSQPSIPDNNLDTHGVSLASYESNTSDGLEVPNHYELNHWGWPNSAKALQK